MKRFDGASGPPRQRVARLVVSVRAALDEEIPQIAAELCAPHLLNLPTSPAVNRLTMSDLNQRFVGAARRQENAIGR